MTIRTFLRALIISIWIFFPLSSSAVSAADATEPKVALIARNVAQESLPVLVTITFDDEDPLVYESAFPILEAQGLPATYFFISSFLNSQWVTRLNDLEDHGWEIGSHSVTHLKLDTLEYSEIVYELSQSKLDLQAAGLNITGFAYPYGIGAKDETILSLVEQYYSYARGVHPGYNTPNIQQYALLAQMYNQEIPVSAMKGWLDTAIAQGKWLIIGLHYVDNDSLYSISSADLTELVGYIKAKVDAGEIQVVTVREAVSIYSSFPPDTTPPNIFNVSASPSAAQAAITWTTDEAASSIVDYGLTPSYDTTIPETDTSPRVTSHSVTLSDLDACTTYHYRVRSRDAAANEEIGEDQTFTTSCNIYLPTIITLSTVP